MTEVKTSVSEDVLKEQFETLFNYGTARELKGISNEQIEGIYAMGVEYYKAGNYANAEKVFQFLVLFEHTSSKYWTSYGSVLQVAKRYDAALKAYQMAAFLDLHNPKPMYYAAECFVKTGDVANARLALRSIEAYAPKDTENGRRFRAKGAALMKSIETK